LPPGGDSLCLTMPFNSAYTRSQTQALPSAVLIEIMKSEHRHELAQNDLELLIGKLRERYAYLVETHGNRILLWASAALLLIAAVIYSVRTSSSTNADGWSALAGARSPEDLAGIAEAYAGTSVGQWARLSVAEQYLQSGIRLMFSDRAASQADLDEAKAAFEELLNVNDISPAIRERALYGMARTLESTSNGDLKPAIDAYNTLLADFPETPYKPAVEEQLERLEKKSSQEFYAWFAEQKPEPADRETPEDLMNQMMPEGLDLPAPAGESDETPQLEENAADQSEETMTPGAEQTPLSVPAAPDFPAGGSQPAASPEAPADMPAPAGDNAAAPADAAKPEAKPEESVAPESKEKAESTEKPAEEKADDGEAKAGETSESKPAAQPESTDSSDSKPEEQPASTEPSEPAANDAN